MDVSYKSSVKKSIVIGPFDTNETTEFLLPVSNISDSKSVSGNINAKYDNSKIYSCAFGFINHESTTSRITCGNRYLETTCETTNCLEICNNETEVTEQLPIVCSSTVLNHLEENMFTENRRVDILKRGTNFQNITSIIDVFGEITNIGSAITNEKVSKELITCSENNEGLAICSEKADELLLTCNKKTETLSNEFSNDICPSSIMKSENVVMSTGRNKLLQIIYEIEKFFDALNSTNNNMQKKSSVLLQKQNLVEEILSYIQAVQSIIRLSSSRSLFTRIIPKENMAIYPHKAFYEAGEHILEELRLYKSKLRADFKVWETNRKEILEISDQMLDEFEYCEDEMSTKVLMHEISTKICKVLKRMELVTSRRDDENEKCIDLMDSVDTYIGYSSAFIVRERTLTNF